MDWENTVQKFCVEFYSKNEEARTYGKGLLTYYRKFQSLVKRCRDLGKYMFRSKVVGGRGVCWTLYTDTTLQFQSSVPMFVSVLLKISSLVFRSRNVGVLSKSDMTLLRTQTNGNPYSVTLDPQCPPTSKSWCYFFVLFLLLHYRCWSLWRWMSFVKGVVGQRTKTKHR